MPKIKFLDSIKNKRKSLVFTHTEDDIVLNLPKEPGILATDLLAKKKINEKNANNNQHLLFILKPDIRENNGGVTATSWDGYFKIATYRPAPGFLGKHTKTEWVAYSDATMKNIVDKSILPIHKEKWKPNTSVPNFKLYVKYRFASNDMYSPWSDTIEANTTSGGIKPFDITVQENTLTPVCSISAFEVYGDAVGANHVSTTWVVYEANGDSLGNKVVESIKDTTNKMSYKIPANILTPEMEYYVQATLHTDIAKYENSTPYARKFLTNSAYINRPSLSYVVENNRHIIKASPFQSSDASQTLVRAIWELRDVFTNRLLNTTTNTSNQYDITMFVTTKGKYSVKLVYHSATLSSKEVTLRFQTSQGTVLPITASFGTSANKTPILKLSKFYVENEIDQVKGFVIKTYYPNRSTNDKLNWFNGKYNENMEFTLSVDQYLNMLNDENIWKKDPLKLTGYLIGNKFNSDIFEATYQSNIDLNYKVVREGTGWDDLKFRVVRDDSINPSNPMPGWMSLLKTELRGDKITTPVVGDHNHIISVPNNGYELNKEYTFTINAKTSLGWKVFEEKVKFDKAIIGASTITVTGEHAGKNYQKLTIKADAYRYNKPIDNTNYLKEAKYMVYSQETNAFVVGGTVVLNGPQYQEDGLSYTTVYNSTNPANRQVEYGKTYRVEVTFKNALGETGPTNVAIYTAPAKTPVQITKPELEAKITQYDANGNPSEIKFKILNEIVISGVDNPVHDKTHWVVKHPNGNVLYNYITPIDKKETIINSKLALSNYVFDNTYTVEAKIIAIEGTESEVGRTTFYNKITPEKFYPIEYVSTETIDNVNWRFANTFRIRIRPTTVASGTVISVSQLKALCNTVTTDLQNHIAIKYPISRIYFNTTTRVREVGTNAVNSVGSFFTIDVSKESNDYAHINTREFPLDSGIDVNNPIPSNLFSQIPSYDTYKALKDMDPDCLTLTIKQEGSNWYLYIRYLVHSADEMNDANLKYTIRPGINYALDTTYTVNDIPSSYGTDNDLKYKTVHIEKTYINSIPLPFKTDSRKSNCFGMTTTEYLNSDIGLSKVNSDHYPIVSIENGVKRNSPYGTPTLEHINYNGAEFGLLLDASWLYAKENNNPIAFKNPKDNLAFHPTNPEVGLVLKLYKINDDKTETLVPNFEASFRGGIIGSNTLLGAIKATNNSVQLEHNKLYKAKVWFRPFHNSYFKDYCYCEKVFVAYDKSKDIVIPPKPKVEIVPNSYNTILEPVGKINYPLGDFLSFNFFYPFTNDFKSSEAGIVPHRDTTFNSLTDLVNGLLQNTTYNWHQQELAFPYLPTLLLHSNKDNPKKGTYVVNRGLIKTIKVNRKITSISGINTSGNDRYKTQYFATSNNAKDFNIGVLSPAPYLVTTLNTNPTTASLFNIKDITDSNRWIDNTNLQSIADRQKVVYYKDTYDKLNLETAKVEMYQWTAAGLATAPELPTIKSLALSNNPVAPNGWMGIYTDKLTEVFKKLFTKGDKLQQVGKGLSIGEEITFTIEFRDGKVDTYKKVIPDWTKEAVVNQQSGIKAEHLIWGPMDNKPAALAASVKDELPPDTKNVVKTLYMHKFTPYADKALYGSDVFTLVEPLTRGIDTFKSPLVNAGAANRSYYPNIQPLAVYYRYGVENSQWISMQPYKKPPYNLHPLYMNTEYGYVTVNDGGYNCAKRSTYMHVLFPRNNKVASTFYKTMPYDMVAVMFWYAYLNFYDIVYYRVNRANGEITYHEEDQNTVFKFEANANAPLLSNKAKSFVHTVNPDGSVVYAPGTKPTTPPPGGGEGGPLPKTGLNVTFHGYIFLSDENGPDEFKVTEQVLGLQFNNDYSKDKIDYISTSFIMFTDDVPADKVESGLKEREKWVLERSVGTTLAKIGSVTGNYDHFEEFDVAVPNHDPLTADTLVHIRKIEASDITALPNNKNNVLYSVYKRVYNGFMDTSKGINDLNLTNMLSGMTGIEDKYGGVELVLTIVLKDGSVLTRCINGFYLANSKYGVIFKYAITIDGDIQGVSKTLANGKTIDYKYLDNLGLVSKAFKYTAPFLEELQGDFSTLMRKVDNNPAKYTAADSIALTNTLAIAHNINKLSNHLYGHEATDVYPMWYKHNCSYEWNDQPLAYATDLPIFPLLLSGNLEELQAKTGKPANQIVGQFMMSGGMINSTQLAEMKTTYDCGNFIFTGTEDSSRRLTNLKTVPSNWFKTVTPAPFTPNELDEVGKTDFKWAHYPATSIAMPYIAMTASKRNSVYNSNQGSDPTANFLVTLNNTNKIAMNYVSRNGASVQLLHVLEPKKAGYSAEEYMVTEFKFKDGTNNVYLKHTANIYKLCLANIQVLTPDTMELEVYKGKLPLPSTDQLVLAVKIYKFNKYFGPNFKLKSRSSNDITLYNINLSNMAFNNVSTILLDQKRGASLSKHRVPRVYYRKGSINSLFVELPNIPLSEGVLNEFKPIDKLLREDTCGYQFQCKGTVAYFTFKTNTVFPQLDNNMVMKPEPYDMILVRTTIDFGIRASREIKEQYTAFRVDPNIGAITQHPEDQGKFYPIERTNGQANPLFSELRGNLGSRGMTSDEYGQ